MSSKFKGLWMGAVQVLGQVQTTVLLSIVYHIAIGPISLLCRLFGKDLLALRPPDTTSYTTELPELSYTSERAKRQF